MATPLRTDWKVSGISQIAIPGRTIFAADGINEVNKVVNEHSAQFVNTGTQINSINQTIQQQSQKIQTNSNAISTFGSQISSVSQTNQNLANQMAAESKARKIFEQNTNPVLQTLTAEVNGLKGTSLLQQATQGTLQTHVADTEGKVVQLENQVATEHGRVDDLQNQIHQAVNGHDLELAAEKNKNAALDQQIKSVQNSLEQEKKEHEQTKGLLVEYMQAVTSLTQQLQAFQEITEKKEKENGQMISQLNQKISSLDVLFSTTQSNTESHAENSKESPRSVEFENRKKAKDLHPSFSKKVSILFNKPKKEG